MPYQVSYPPAEVVCGLASEASQSFPQQVYVEQQPQQVVQQLVHVEQQPQQQQPQQLVHIVSSPIASQQDCHQQQDECSVRPTRIATGGATPVFTVEPSGYYTAENWHPKSKPKLCGKVVKRLNDNCSKFVKDALAVGDEETARGRPFIRRPPPCVFVPYVQRRRPESGMLAVEAVKHKRDCLGKTLLTIPQTFAGLCKRKQPPTWLVQRVDPGQRETASDQTTTTESSEYSEEEMPQRIIVTHQPQQQAVLSGTPRSHPLQPLLSTRVLPTPHAAAPEQQPQAYQVWAQPQQQTDSQAQVYPYSQPEHTYSSPQQPYPYSQPPPQTYIYSQPEPQNPPSQPEPGPQATPVIEPSVTAHINVGTPRSPAEMSNQFQQPAFYVTHPASPLPPQQQISQVQLQSGNSPRQTPRQTPRQSLQQYSQPGHLSPLVMQSPNGQVTQPPSPAQICPMLQPGTTSGGPVGMVSPVGMGASPVYLVSISGQLPDSQRPTSGSAQQSSPMSYLISPIQISGAAPQTAPMAPQVVSMSQQMLPMPQQVVPMPQQVVSMPQQTLPMPQQMVSMPQQMLPMPQQMLPMPQQMLPMPQQMLPMPQQMVSMPQQMVSMPTGMFMPMSSVIVDSSQRRTTGDTNGALVCLQVPEGVHRALGGGPSGIINMTALPRRSSTKKIRRHSKRPGAKKWEVIGPF